MYQPFSAQSAVTAKQFTYALPLTLWDDLALVCQLRTIWLSFIPEKDVLKYIFFPHLLEFGSVT